jgi:hypothetical protein
MFGYTLIGTQTLLTGLEQHARRDIHDTRLCHVLGQFARHPAGAPANVQQPVIGFRLQERKELRGISEMKDPIVKWRKPIKEIHSY